MSEQREQEQRSVGTSLGLISALDKGPGWRWKYAPGADEIRFGRSVG
jgi:hypothetical protein